MKLEPLSALLLAFLAGVPGADELTDRVDEVFAAYDTDDAPGMSVAVLRDGQTLYARGYGLASLEYGIPNGPETVFRIGSTSKQFTATCIAMLALRGELDLDADVRTWFPAMHEYESPVTVRHLVHHTSGIRDYIELETLAWGRGELCVTPQQSIAAIERQRGLAFAPGERYQYSNSNYLLLGEIVRRVSGETLAEFAEARVFGPLGMENSHYQDRHDRVVANRAFGYSQGPGGEWRLDITTLDHVGDGSVFTTVRDLALWDANFYGNRLEGGEELLPLMHTTGVLNDGSELDYAFALGIDTYRGLRTVSHGGAWVGYRAQMTRFPDQRFTVICLANRSDVNPSTLCLRVADVYLEAELAAAEAALAAAAADDTAEQAEPAGASPDEPRERGSTPDPEAVQDLLGGYWSPELEVEWELRIEDGRLVLDRGLARPSRLRALAAADELRHGPHTLRFQRDGEGRPTGFLLSSDRYGDFVFTRR